MPAVEADLETVRCVSVKLCVARASHTDGMPVHYPHVCLPRVSIPVFLSTKLPTHMPTHVMHITLCWNNELSFLALPVVMMSSEAGFFFLFRSLLLYFPYFVGDEDYAATFNRAAVSLLVLTKQCLPG